MTLPGPSIPGRQFLDRHSNPNPDPNANVNPNPNPYPIPNPVQELTVQELTWYLHEHSAAGGGYLQSRN